MIHMLHPTTHDSHVTTTAHDSHVMTCNIWFACYRQTNRYLHTVTCLHLSHPFTSTPSSPSEHQKLHMVIVSSLPCSYDGRLPSWGFRYQFQVTCRFTCSLPPCRHFLLARIQNSIASACSTTSCHLSSQPCASTHELPLHLNPVAADSGSAHE